MERPALRNSVTATLVQPSDFQDLLDPLLLLDSHVTPALPTQQPTDTDQQSMHDRDWLLNACADHIARFMPDAGLEAKQLTQDIFDLLRSKRNGTHIFQWSSE